MTDRFAISEADAQRILDALHHTDETFPMSAHQVHRECGVWAKETCRQKLKALVHQGRVCRKQLPSTLRRGEFMWVYWKAATPAPAPTPHVETTVMGAG